MQIGHNYTNLKWAKTPLISTHCHLVMQARARKCKEILYFARQLSLDFAGKQKIIQSSLESHQIFNLGDEGCMKTLENAH